MQILQSPEKTLPLRQDSSKGNFVRRDDNPLKETWSEPHFKSRYLAAFFIHYSLYLCR